MTGFDQLHPSIRHHIVNTLGWPQLRPLQEQAIEPVMAGEHGLFLAPTAGGKTEAAVFPVFSAMATQNWRPLSVLYLAPLRALLNNLFPRLEAYGGFVGRRVGIWHGDTGQGERARIISDPPDLLLTTPESLEAMLISRRVNQDWLLANVRTVVIDEVHAFASADRGWHLLAVLERLTRIAGRDLQRLGLSATVGNPDALLEWMCGSSGKARRVANPPADVLAEPEVTLDYVGSLDNAATVISRLHRGEKRLVFVDSRRRVEELGVALRARDTEIFVSHGSLSREERNRSEKAFSEARDCVIVATSTLELGIDIGDLDRVIQIDSPPTVAGFLQRMGRTGRRSGASRNALILATTPRTLLTAAAILRLWVTGFVEPAEPPVLPVHLIAQQLLALTLQEADRGLGRSTWQEWLGDPPVLGPAVMNYAEELLAHLQTGEWLHEDTGLLSPGRAAEATVGRRNFLELTSVFVADPLVLVRQGRTEIGQVPDVAITAAFATKEGVPAILLAGRTWRIKSVDWRRRIAQAEPADQKASVRFPGIAQPLSYEICQSMAAVLDDAPLESVDFTERAVTALEQLRSELRGARPGRTLLLSAANGTRWYTFAGLRANLELAARVAPLRSTISQRDDLFIAFGEPVDRHQLRAAIEKPTPRAELARLVADVSGALKLQRVLPEHLVEEILVSRLRDSAAVAAVETAALDVADRS